MRFVSYLILCFLILSPAHGQTAVISDPDGYCNIRENGKSDARVIDTIHNGRLVFAFDDEEDDWLPVDYKRGRSLHSGFIHRSRLTFLHSLPKSKIIAQTETSLKLQLGSYMLNVTTEPFIKTGRKIAYEKQEDAPTLVKTIDGKFPWGTDGRLPKDQYKLIQLSSGKTILNFPKAAYADLFEPGLDFTTAYFDKRSGRIYLEASNSDAAGSYEVVWIIQSMKIIGREIFIPF